MRPFGSLLWKRFDTHPPVLLRLLSRHPHGEPLSTAEIAERSGLSPMQVEALSQQTDWRGADMPTVRAFLKGTGCDLFDRRQFKRMRAYLRTAHPDPRRRFSYLQRSPDWRGLYLPLLEKLRAHLCSQPTQ